MNIITRNKRQVLNTEGEWTHAFSPDSAKVFQSYQSAKEFVEKENLPEEFVSIDNLDQLHRKNLNSRSKIEKQERKDNRRCKYVRLAEPETFYKSTDKDCYCFVFETFTATHAIMIDGSVIGTFGHTSNERTPFYSYLNDEYWHVFQNCYAREQQPTTEVHDYRTEGF